MVMEPTQAEGLKTGGQLAEEPCTALGMKMDQAGDR